MQYVGGIWGDGGLLNAEHPSALFSCHFQPLRAANKQWEPEIRPEGNVQDCMEVKRNYKVKLRDSVPIEKSFWP